MQQKVQKKSSGGGVWRWAVDGVVIVTVVVVVVATEGAAAPAAAGFALAAASSSCDTPTPPKRHDPTKDKPGTNDSHSDGGHSTSGTMNGPQNGATLPGEAVKNMSDDVAGYISSNVESSLEAILQGATDTAHFNAIDDDEDNGCGSGWIKYGAPDKKNGRRSTAVEACITDNLLDTGSYPSSNPPAYKWAKDFANSMGVDDDKLSVNACHLIAKRLGGTGSKYNLATCGRSTNSYRQDPTDPGRPGSMVEFEDDTYNEVKASGPVRYRIDPMYLGNRTVPYAFVMIAQSSKGNVRADVVPNTIYSPNQGRWINIGIESCPTPACTNPLPTPGVK